MPVAVAGKWRTRIYVLRSEIEVVFDGETYKVPNPFHAPSHIANPPSCATENTPSVNNSLSNYIGADKESSFSNAGTLQAPKSNADTVQEPQSAANSVDQPQKDDQSTNSKQ